VLCFPSGVLLTFLTGVAMLSLRKLGLPVDIVSVFRKSDAPVELQELDLDGRVRVIYVVPTGVARNVQIHGARYEEKLSGGIAYGV